MSELKTSDTALASTLICLGHQLVGIEDESPRRKAFIFNGDAEKDRLGYFQGIHRVEPRALFDSFRRLKSLIFETQ